MNNLLLELSEANIDPRTDLQRRSSVIPSPKKLLNLVSELRLEEDEDLVPSLPSTSKYADSIVKRRTTLQLSLDMKSPETLSFQDIEDVEKEEWNKSPVLKRLQPTFLPRRDVPTLVESVEFTSRTTIRAKIQNQRTLVKRHIALTKEQRVNTKQVRKRLATTLRKSQHISEDEIAKKHQERIYERVIKQRNLAAGRKVKQVDITRKEHDAREKIHSEETERRAQDHLEVRWRKKQLHQDLDFIDLLSELHV